MTLTVLAVALVAMLSLTGVSALAHTSGHDGSKCTYAKAYSVGWFGTTKGDTRKLHLKVTRTSSDGKPKQTYKATWKTVSKKQMVCRAELQIVNNADPYHPKIIKLKSGKYSGKKAYTTPASQSFGIVVLSTTRS